MFKLIILMPIGIITWSVAILFLYCVVTSIFGGIIQKRKRKKEEIQRIKDLVASNHLEMID